MKIETLAIGLVVLWFLLQNMPTIAETAASPKPIEQGV